MKKKKLEMMRIGRFMKELALFAFSFIPFRLKKNFIILALTKIRNRILPSKTFASDFLKLRSDLRSFTSQMRCHEQCHKGLS